MTTINKTLAQLVEKLSLELKKQKLWQAKPPSVQALSSVAPFHCDTLAFEQWLQFIFIERINALIAANKTLPTAISLCPMAEDAFKLHGASIANVINIIADIDELMSGKREQTLYVR